MSVAWGQVIQITPKLWVKLGCDDAGLLHLMCGSAEEVQKMEGIQYMKLAGRWYIEQASPTCLSNKQKMASRFIFIEADVNCDQIVRITEAKQSSSPPHID